MPDQRLYLRAVDDDIGIAVEAVERTRVLDLKRRFVGVLFLEILDDLLYFFALHQT
ncbi:hypothetical protein GFS60_07614 (plasmid) [Rhodococcus sp. WAY2]|nr:hypothetical protein GFS60_07614 [Rhodococcus sp. WAY2]